MRPSRRVMAAAFCLVLILSLSVIQLALGETSGDVLTVGVPVDRWPIFYMDTDMGEAVGIGVDLMRYAAEAAGCYEFK